MSHNGALVEMTEVPASSAKLKGLPLMNGQPPVAPCRVLVKDGKPLAEEGLILLRKGT